MKTEIKKALREIFYEIGYFLEGSILDSVWAYHFYKNLAVRPPRKEIKHLIEEGTFSEIKKEAVIGSPFNYRKAMKDTYNRLGNQCLESNL